MTLEEVKKILEERTSYTLQSIKQCFRTFKLIGATGEWVLTLIKEDSLFESGSEFYHVSYTNPDYPGYTVEIFSGGIFQGGVRFEKLTKREEVVTTDFETIVKKSVKREMDYEVNKLISDFRKSMVDENITDLTSVALSKQFFDNYLIAVYEPLRAKFRERNYVEVRNEFVISRGKVSKVFSIEKDLTVKRLANMIEKELKLDTNIDQSKVKEVSKNIAEYVIDSYNNAIAGQYIKKDTVSKINETVNSFAKQVNEIAMEILNNVNVLELESNEVLV